jgi:hypothetical protein
LENVEELPQDFEQLLKIEFLITRMKRQKINFQKQLENTEDKLMSGVETKVFAKIKKTVTQMYEQMI